MFEKYRILEINGKFMPQYRKYFLDEWEEIGDHYTWRSSESVKEIFARKTIEEARGVIDRHKEKIKKNKPIIHKYGK